ncbi:MAG TPA: hypothetical protein VLN49_01040 [Gemmatimonadaceae bacterium]|nr:hypothetical protein [Gemmatimonadaceae bacterium]
MTYLAALFAHYAPYAWFAAIWTIPIAVLGAVGLVTLEGTGPRQSGRPGRALRILWPPSTSFVLPILALAAFVSVFSYVIFYREDLVGLDYATVTAGRFVAILIHPASGRFFPLALQEYNLLAILGRSAGVYAAFAVCQLLVVIGCAFRVLDEVPAWLSCILVAFMITLPGVFVAIATLVYPERDVIFWLALWIVCVHAFDRTRSLAAFFCAVVTAQAMLYYKETSFLLVGGFAGARLAINVLRARDDRRRRAYGRFASDNVLEIALLALCAVFLAVYFVMIAPHVTQSYAMSASRAHSWLESIESYARSDYLLDAFVIVVAGRLAWLAIRRHEPDSFWDPLAIGALCYALAFVKLGMTREYYQAPVEFVGTMYLARLAYAALRGQRRLIIALSLVPVVLVFQRNVSDAASRLLARKQYVEGNVRLASFLKDYSQSHGRARLELYFPQVGGFELMELSSFLRYKGLRAAGDSIGGSPASPGFIMKTAHRYPADRCYPTQVFRCTYARAPVPGDLLVFLSGREVPAEQLGELKVSAVEVFHYRPDAARIERALDALVPADRKPDRTPDVRVFEYSGDPRGGASGR